MYDVILNYPPWTGNTNICEYFPESAGSEGGVHHTAAGDIQGEEKTVAVEYVH